MKKTIKKKPVAKKKKDTSNSEKLCSEVLRMVDYQIQVIDFMNSDMVKGYDKIRDEFKPVNIRLHYLETLASETKVYEEGNTISLKNIAKEIADIKTALIALEQRSRPKPPRWWEFRRKIALSKLGKEFMAGVDAANKKN